MKKLQARAVLSNLAKGRWWLRMLSVVVFLELVLAPLTSLLIGAMPVNAAASAGCVKAWEHVDFDLHGGASKEYCSGFSNMDSFWNDNISSIEVSSNTQVTVYEHINGEGASRTFSSSVSNLVNIPGPSDCGGDWNDCISSLEVTSTGKPDLEVINQSIQDSGPYYPGDDIYVRARVINYGNAQAGASVLGYWISDSNKGEPINNGLKVTTDISSLASQEYTGYLYKNVPIPSSISEAGTYYVVFEADTYNDVRNEQYEENNRRAISFTVSENTPDWAAEPDGSLEFNVYIDPSTGRSRNDIEVRYRNTGSKTWYDQDSNNDTVLLTYRHRDGDNGGANPGSDGRPRESAFRCSDWPNPNNEHPWWATYLDQSPVYENNTGSFTMHFCNDRGKDPGIYTEQFDIAYFHFSNETGDFFYPGGWSNPVRVNIHVEEQSQSHCAVYPNGVEVTHNASQLHSNSQFPDGFFDNDWDANLYTGTHGIINYADEPVAVILSYNEIQNITGFKTLFSHCSDTNCYRWKVESANSLSDLNDKSGSYRLLSDFVETDQGVISEISFSPSFAQHYRLTAERTIGDGYVHWRDIGITCDPNLEPTTLEADFESQTQPSQTQYNENGDEYFDMREGDTVNLEVKFKNTGTEKWRRDPGYGQVVLSTHKIYHEYPSVNERSAPDWTHYDECDPNNTHPDCGKSYFKHGSWIDDFKAATLDKYEVGQDDTGTFNVTFEIPENAQVGRYREGFALFINKGNADNPDWQVIPNPYDGHPPDLGTYPVNYDYRIAFAHIPVEIHEPTITDWRGEYFNNKDLSGSPVLIRNDVDIDFNWGSGSPAPSVNSNNFSVKWSRDLHFEEGTYDFHTTTDDGVRLKIDDETLIDQWRDMSATTFSKSKYLSEGNHYVVMEYYENEGGASAKLWWDYYNAQLLEAPSGIVQIEQGKVSDNLTVRYANTGDAAWTSPGGLFIREQAGEEEKETTKKFKCENNEYAWDTDAAGNRVQPFSSGTEARFDFRLCSNSLELGTYEVGFQVANRPGADGGDFIGKAPDNHVRFTVEIVPAIPEYEAKWISMEPQPTDPDEHYDVAQGKTLELTIKYQNLGKAEWKNVPGKGQVVLATYKTWRKSAPESTGYDDPNHPDYGKSYFYDADTWLTETRPATMVETSVDHEETATFIVRLKVRDDAEIDKFIEGLALATDDGNGNWSWIGNNTNGEGGVAYSWIGIDVLEAYRAKWISQTGPDYPEHNNDRVLLRLDDTRDLEVVFENTGAETWRKDDYGVYNVVLAVRHPSPWEAYNVPDYLDGSSVVHYNVGQPGGWISYYRVAYPENLTHPEKDEIEPGEQAVFKFKVQANSSLPDMIEQLKAGQPFSEGFALGVTETGEWVSNPDNGDPDADGRKIAYAWWDFRVPEDYEAIWVEQYCGFDNVDCQTKDGVDNLTYVFNESSINLNVKFKNIGNKAWETDKAVLAVDHVIGQLPDHPDDPGSSIFRTPEYGEHNWINHNVAVKVKDLKGDSATINPGDTGLVNFKLYGGKNLLNIGDQYGEYFSLSQCTDTTYSNCDWISNVINGSSADRAQAWWNMRLNSKVQAKFIKQDYPGGEMVRVPRDGTTEIFVEFQNLGAFEWSMQEDSVEKNNVVIAVRKDLRASSNGPECYENPGICDEVDENGVSKYIGGSSVLSHESWSSQDGQHRYWAGYLVEAKNPDGTPKSSNKDVVGQNEIGVFKIIVDGTGPYAKVGEFYREDFGPARVKDSEGNPVAIWLDDYDTGTPENQAGAWWNFKVYQPGVWEYDFIENASKATWTDGVRGGGEENITWAENNGDGRGEATYWHRVNLEDENQNPDKLYNLTMKVEPKPEEKGFVSAKYNADIPAIPEGKFLTYEMEIGLAADAGEEENVLVDFGVEGEGKGSQASILSRKTDNHLVPKGERLDYIRTDLTDIVGQNGGNFTFWLNSDVYRAFQDDEIYFVKARLYYSTQRAPRAIPPEISDKKVVNWTGEQHNTTIDLFSGESLGPVWWNMENVSHNNVTLTYNHFFKRVQKNPEPSKVFKVYDRYGYEVTDDRIEVDGTFQPGETYQFWLKEIVAPEVNEDTSVKEVWELYGYDINGEEVRLIKEGGFSYEGTVKAVPTSRGFILPFKEKRMVTQAWGPGTPTHNDPGYIAIDFGCLNSDNQEIVSIASGVIVRKITNDGTYGNYMVIRHRVDGKEYYSKYAHLQDKEWNRYQYGDTVEQGATIGLCGDTGSPGQWHLHFEFKTSLDYGTTDPVWWMGAYATTEACQEKISEGCWYDPTPVPPTPPEPEECPVNEYMATYTLGDTENGIPSDFEEAIGELYLNRGGGNLVVPSGTYYIDNTIEIKAPIHVVGTDPNDKPHFVARGVSDAPMFSIEDWSGDYKVESKGFTCAVIDGAKKAQGIKIVDSDNVVIKNSTIKNGKAYSGGGIAIINNSRGGDTRITNSFIEDNEATKGGGGLSVLGIGEFYKDSSPDYQWYQLKGPCAPAPPDTVAPDYQDISQDVVLWIDVSDSFITDNTVEIFGGGFFVAGKSAHLSMTRGQVDGNRVVENPTHPNSRNSSNATDNSGGGGTICNQTGATFTGTKFKNNETPFHGAGVYNTVYTKVMYKDVEFYSNEAAEAGGAIYASCQSDIELRDSTIASNSVGHDPYGTWDDKTQLLDIAGGGGVFLKNSKMKSSGNTFENNKSNKYEGGAVSVNKINVGIFLPCVVEPFAYGPPKWESEGNDIFKNNQAGKTSKGSSIATWVSPNYGEIGKVSLDRIRLEDNQDTSGIYISKIKEFSLTNSKYINSTIEFEDNNNILNGEIKWNDFWDDNADIGVNFGRNNNLNRFYVNDNSFHGFTPNEKYAVFVEDRDTCGNEVEALGNSWNGHNEPYDAEICDPVIIDNLEASQVTDRVKYWGAIGGGDFYLTNYDLNQGSGGGLSNLDISLQNGSLIDWANASLELTSSDPYISVTQGQAGPVPLPAGQTTTISDQFQLSISPDYPVGHSAKLDLKIEADQGTTTTSFKVPGNLKAEFWDFRNDEVIESLPTFPPTTDSRYADNYSVRWPDNVNFPYDVDHSLTFHNGRDLQPMFYDRMVGRITGYFKAEDKGRHYFYMTSDDGAKLFINDRLVINEDRQRAMDEGAASGSISLNPGWHKFEVQYFEDLGGNGLVLEYKAPGMSEKEIIPPEHFAYNPGEWQIFEDDSTVEFTKHQLTKETGSVVNSLVNPGEDIDLAVYLKNNTSSDISMLRTYLSTNNTYVTISDKYEPVYDIAAGAEERTNGAFDFQVSPDANPGDLVQFVLKIVNVDTNETYYDSFTIEIKDPDDLPDPSTNEFSFSRYKITKETGSVVNMQVNPGEDIDMAVYVNNNSDRIIAPLRTYLSTTNPHVTISDQYEPVYDLAPNSEGRTWREFDFQVSADAQVGEQIPFILKMEDRGEQVINFDTFVVEVKDPNAEPEPTSDAVKFESYEITRRGIDNKAVPGADTDMRVQLRSDGVATSRVKAYLSTDNEFVTIKDDYEVASNLSAGGTVWTGVFDYDVDANIPAENPIEFKLKVLWRNDETSRFEDMNVLTFSVPVYDVSTDGGFSYSRYAITRELNGLVNNQVNPGEDIDLAAYVKNESSRDIARLKTWLSTENPNVTITDDYEVIRDLGANSEARTRGPFDFVISDQAQAGEVITFKLKMTDPSSGLTLENTFDIEVKDPSELPPVNNDSFSYSTHKITRELGGVENKQVNPGEDVDLALFVKNNGSNDVERLRVTLSTANPNVTITDSNEAVLELAAGSEGRTSGEFDFVVSNDVAVGEQIPFIVRMEDRVAGVINFDTFTLEVKDPAAPPEPTSEALKFESYRLTRGNVGEKVKAGTDVDMQVEIRSAGVTSSRVKAYLFTDNEFVTISDNYEIARDLQDGQTAWTGKFDYQVDENIPQGSSIEFSVNAMWRNDQTGDFEEMSVLNFSVPVEGGVNNPPLANAGEDQTVNEAAEVTLDGSGSSDPDPGDTLTYSWSQASGPSVTLSDASAQQPTFTAPDVDQDETLTFELVVNDGQVDSQPDQVTVTLKQVNKAPIVTQIPDQTVDEDTAFTTFDLDDYGSDPDPWDTLTWSHLGNSSLQVSIDAENVVTITSPENWNGEESITFTATDSSGESASSTAVFKVDPVNDAPTQPSNPTPVDGAVDQELDISLSWSASSDVDGDAVVYDVYFGEDQANLPLVSENQIEIEYTPTLSAGKTYHWKIVAKDGNGEEAASPTWQFATKSQQIDLQWNQTTNLPQTGVTPFLQAGREIVVHNGYLYVFPAGVNGNAQPTKSYYAKINADGTLANWNTTSAPPGNYYDQAVVRVGDYVYHIAGAAGQTSVYFAKINADGTIGTWAETTSLQPSRQNFAVATYGNYIYESGGNSGGPRDFVKFTSVNSDGSLNPWQDTTVLPEVMEGHTMNAYNGKLYVFAKNSHAYYATINADGTIGNWTSTTAMPQAMSGYTTFTKDNNVFLLGGGSSKVYYAQVNADGSLGTWQETSPLPEPRKGAFAGASDSAVYVIGGKDGSTWKNTVFYAVQ